MRLPWEQLAMEVIEVSAPELGDKLYPDLEPELGEAAAGWGIVHLVKWALARCPEHLPPSASALVPGPTAARQIARAARWKGKPEAYITAISSLPNPVVETVPEGIRVRGLDRYDAAWGDRHPKEWEAYKAAHPEKYPPKPPSKGRRTSGGDPAEPRPSDPHPDPDADAKRDAATDANAESKKKTSSEGEAQISADACWSALQRQRADHDPPLAAELRPPKGFTEWHDGAIAEGFSPGELATAYAVYLTDDDFRLKGWPTAVFICDGVWRVRTRIPPRKQRWGR